MAYGIVEYNDEGLPMCEVCGRHFARVLTHVRQKHDMAEREYKQLYGFDLKKGICSKESSEKTSQNTLEHYEVIVENLIKRGSKSRFTKGAQGRTKDQVSQQTRLMLKERLKNPKMVAAMKKAGQQVGKSWKGNQKRWGNKNQNTK